MLQNKFFSFPLTKIGIGLIVCILSVRITQFGVSKGLQLVGVGQIERNLITGLFAAVVAVASYVFLYRFYEQRRIDELSAKRIGRNILLGILIGGILQSLVVTVIYFNGGLTVVSVNNAAAILPYLTMSFTAAIFEEIIFRGIIFRITEEKLGSYWALGISALLFGFVHIANPNSTFIAALGLAIQAGILLGAAYMFTRNLWFPIAMHFAWNFVQGNIFGANVSGHTIDSSLLTTRIEGNPLITGGEFGPEGSVQATVFCLIAAIVLIVVRQRKGEIILPYWKVKNN